MQSQLDLKGLTAVPLADVNTVVDYLLERCLGAPMALRVAGMTISTYSRGQEVERDTQSMEVSRIADQQ